MPARPRSYVDHYVPDSATSVPGLGGVPEAPLDGKNYMRCNADWEEVTGGGGGGGNGGVQKTGDTMTGPLGIVTATKPELHLTDAAGVQTLDLNSTGLKVADSSLGNSVEIALASVVLLGSGAASGASANKTNIGVNSISLGHKSWNLGNSPVQLYQGNQGELFVQFPVSGQNYRLTDFANSRLFCPTNSLSMTSPTPGAAAVTVVLNDTGDIIATQQTGPNAGKTVNLTAGHWA
jgi:hypothetical protein